MADLNSLSIIFSNLVGGEFTLGKLNDGFPPPDLSQDMYLSQSVSSPLAGLDQAVTVNQKTTLVDDAKKLFLPLAVAANPSGCATVSVVWTSYDMNLRFGIQASVSMTRLDAAEAVGTSRVNLIPGVDVSVDPTFAWSYMLDDQPDQPGTWVQPSSLTERVVATLGKYQHLVTPTLEEFSLTIRSTIQPS